MSALKLAKYIVSKCESENSPISNLQLQKILYYIQKKFLQEFNSIAFEDTIEAWQFGPVVPSVYYEFCGYAAMPITADYSDVPLSEPLKSHLSLINNIILDKRAKDPWVLVDETHRPSGAWAAIYNDGFGNHSVIPLDLIKNLG